MCRGNEEPLTNRIDNFIKDGIPLNTIQSQLISLANQYGVEKKEVKRLINEKFFRWKGLQLNNNSKRLIKASTSAFNAHSRKLMDLHQRLFIASNSVIEAYSQRLIKTRQHLMQRWQYMDQTVHIILRKRNPEWEFHISLGFTDERLVSGWRRNAMADRIEEDHRLRSARKAEKAALKYFRGLGQQVDDVSIQQIQQLYGQTQDWKRFDLRVDGRPIDVKNIRCFRIDRFAELYWKTRKSAGIRNVPIVGVVWIEDKDRSVVIGELEQGELRRFSESVRSYRVASEIQVTMSEESRFVPGWLLDYPEAHYRDFPDWANVTQQWIDLAPELDADVPDWILGFAASRSLPLNRVARQDHMLDDINRHFHHFGLSRRAVFWFVLLHMLSRMRDPQRAADELNRYLFPKGVGGQSFPLGLFDPRKYIWSLVHTLQTIIEANREILLRASRFKFPGLGILKAEIDHQWLTILAYCGDCGKSPIFLNSPDNSHRRMGEPPGSCRSCPCSEKRLVCDRCGSCSGRRCRAGVRYETTQEALEAVPLFPRWTLKGSSLYPPSRKSFNAPRR